MRNLISTTVVAATLILLASSAHAQVGGGLCPGGLPGARGLMPGTPPPATMSMPQTPAQQWVPERRQFDSAIGRDIQVPGHYADRTPDGRLIEPPMTIPNPGGGPPVFLRGGESPAPGITREDPSVNLRRCRVVPPEGW